METIRFDLDGNAFLDEKLNSIEIDNARKDAAKHYLAQPHRRMLSKLQIKYWERVGATAAAEDKVKANTRNVTPMM